MKFPYLLHLLLLVSLNLTAYYEGQTTLAGRPYFPMPEIWVCERCGFRNYEGIDKCPVCGTFRWQEENAL
ncbi:MAG: hypothetical protein ACSNEK_00355 [Parachlamydiaceae bacterium]